MKTRGLTTMLGRAPRIEIDLTQEHIANGVARNSNHCMVAEALRDKYPELKHIAVDIQTIRATDKKKRERYVWLTPRSVQQHIINFDRGKKLEPFRFYCRDGQVVECNSKKIRKASMRKSRGGNRQTVPEKVGGRTPPKSIGQRRSYGLRSMVL